MSLIEDLEYVWPTVTQMWNKSNEMENDKKMSIES